MLAALLLSCLALFWGTQGALVATLSSYSTLVSANYVLNLTFASASIPAGTTAIVTFSTRFSVSNTSLQNCAYLTSSASTYATTPCSAATASSVELLFSGPYPSAAAGQTSISLKVRPCPQLVYNQQPLGGHHRVLLLGAQVGGLHPHDGLQRHQLCGLALDQLPLE
jgi:hypothetical protein